MNPSFGPLTQNAPNPGFIVWSCSMSAQPLRVSEPRPSAPAIASRPIDLVHLSRQTLGDRDLEIELLALFERQAGLIMQQIAQAGGPRPRGDLAHTLKGSARAVGATHVADAAEAIEETLAHGAAETDLSGALARLEAAVADARAAARSLVTDK